MKKIIITIFSVFILANIVSFSRTLDNEIIVDNEGDGDYTNIQDAIDNASEGDIIKVYSGFYKGDIIINKRIILIGVPEEFGRGNDTGKPVIDGGNNAVTVIANNVVISGFIIQNASSGVKILSNYNKIEENVIRNCEIGIFFNQCK